MKLIDLFKKLGESLIIPISVLPGAGILLGLGSAHFSFIPANINNIILIAGGAVFSIIPLLFAIGIALGFTSKNGIAAMAATVGYFVFLASSGAGVSYFLNLEISELLETKKLIPTLGIPSVNIGIFGGVIIGIITSVLFNKYKEIELPMFLSFFGGERFIPIITMFFSVFAGILASVVWPPISSLINIFSQWAAYENQLTAFVMYGVVERFLLPFGLNQLWNAPFFFEIGEYMNPDTGLVVKGEIARYISGDPAAGNLAGGYLFKMFGLPAAAIAIWHSAKEEHKKKVGGMMLSAAGLSFLTGITEPIEFSFLFVAPILYVIHALFSGLAFGICVLLGIKHGTSFSHGLTDFLIYFPLSYNAIWIIPLGIVYAIMYYFVFLSLIRIFDLKTPGRE